MDMRIPPLKLKILLESNPLKSRILVSTEIGHNLQWGAFSALDDGHPIKFRVSNPISK